MKQAAEAAPLEDRDGAHRGLERRSAVQGPGEAKPQEARGEPPKARPGGRSRRARRAWAQPWGPSKGRGPAAAEEAA